MKFFVFLVSMGFALNLHAEVTYAPGESRVDGVYEHELGDDKVGTGFQTASCGDCNTAQKNQRRLSTNTNMTTSGSSSSSSGEE